MPLNRSRHSKAVERRTQQPRGRDQMAMNRQITRDVYESREIVEEDEDELRERLLRNKLELDKAQRQSTRDDRQRMIDEHQAGMRPMRPEKR